MEAKHMMASTAMTSLKRTALFSLHKELEGKMTDFSGYSLPLLYGSDGILASCLHTRAEVSLFDTSHMGQIRLYGKDRVAFLEALTVGDIKAMEPTESKLTLFTNQKGGIIDDSIITTQKNYINIVINAGCKDKDLEHIQSQIHSKKNEFPDVHMELLDEHALLALQGPLAMEVLQPLLHSSLDLNKLSFMRGIEVDVDGVPECVVTRCGYTGEDGFEISIPNKYAESVARRLLSNSHVKPAGLGARDSLRLEAGMCLYGHDIDETTTPVEAALSWTIGKRRRQEKKFPGAAIILDQLQNGLMTKGAPAREGCPILDAGADECSEAIGIVTSGSFSPSLKAPIAMGYVKVSKAKPMTPLRLKVHQKLQEAHVVKMPFVESSYYTAFL